VTYATSLLDALYLNHSLFKLTIFKNYLDMSGSIILKIARGEIHESPARD
jgi:hypothetical protein